MASSASTHCHAATSESDWDLIKKNLHGSYYLSLMGPRLQGNSNETYNVYITDVAPVQLFHAIQLGYKVSDGLEIGFKDSAVQNLYDQVVGNTGLIYNHSFLIYDPAIYFNLPNFIHIKGWSVFTTVSFSLAVTKASQDVGKITSLHFSQSYNLNTWPSPWSFGMGYDINPSFYVEPNPSTLNRQSLAVSLTPYLGYRVSPTFGLQASPNFDFEHKMPDPQGSLHLGPGLEDFMKLSCNITPQTGSLMLSIGGYLQFLLYNPQTQSSILGADFSIGF